MSKTMNGTLSVLAGQELKGNNSYAISYLDRKSERCLYNISPETIKKQLRNGGVQKYLKWDEERLKEELKPTVNNNRLRISFWKEYDAAQAENRDIVEVNIYRGICTLEKYQSSVKSNKLAAWILTPPANYVVAMEESLSQGIEKMREILEMPLYYTEFKKNEHGEIERLTTPNTKVADLIIKTVNMLDLRVKGALVKQIEQKITQTSTSTNLNVNAPTPADVTVEVDANALQEEIEKLEKSFKTPGLEFTKEDKKLMAKHDIDAEVIEEAIVIDEQSRD